MQIAKLKKLEPHHQLVPIPLLPGQVNKLQPALRSVFPERATYVEFDSERGLAIHRRNLPAAEIELSRQARARLGLLLDWHISGAQHLELRQVRNYGLQLHLELRQVRNYCLQLLSDCRTWWPLVDTVLM